MKLYDKNYLKIVSRKSYAFNFVLAFIGIHIPLIGLLLLLVWWFCLFCKFHFNFYFDYDSMAIAATLVVLKCIICPSK
jgi:hypothetical protein